MGYLAVAGSVDAIAAARALARPTGGRETVERLLAHLPRVLDEVQAEAGLWEPRLAAIAVAQARGDVTEAAFLLRAFRSTLARRAPAQAGSRDLRPVRRISSAFRDVPGGQILGATGDYGLRLLDVDLNGRPDARPVNPSPWNGNGARPGGEPDMPKVVDLLRTAGVLAGEGAPGGRPDDITRSPLRFPASRSARLQALARGQGGALTAFAYANLRGYGPFHPTLGELRAGFLPVRVPHPRTGALVEVGEVPVTEAEVVGQKPNSEDGRIGAGYGCVFGHGERKAIAMAVMDAVLAGLDDNAPFDSPLADEEFVLAHLDGIEASGFVDHLKLPHEVTFASDVDRRRQLQGDSP